jgi:phage-related minor tail protein
MTKEQTKALTVIERAALALGTAEHEKKLVELAAESKAIVEIKNGPGRDQCHGAAMKLRNTRTGIRATGKGARDDATKFSKAVIAEEDRLVSLIEPEEQRLLALRDVWDAAREAEKRAKAEAEAKRVALIREHIEDIRAIAVRAVGRRAEAIQIELADLIELGIDIPRFAELTGEAEQVRRATVDKLQGLYAAALAQEVEAARLAEERAALERERAALAEQQRQEAAARAEQERKDGEVRAAREAAERAQREREEAARREQQAREDAERRAAFEAEQKRLAAERAEMDRRQAEIDRAEREQRERAEAEAKAKLEIAEAEARAKHAEKLRQQREEEEADACMIAAMHEMYETLSEVSNWLYSSNANDALRKRVDAVLDKATYQPAKAAA